MQLYFLRANTCLYYHNNNISSKQNVGKHVFRKKYTDTSYGTLSGQYLLQRSSLQHIAVQWVPVTVLTIVMLNISIQRTV